MFAPCFTHLVNRESTDCRGPVYVSRSFGIILILITTRILNENVEHCLWEQILLARRFARWSTKAKITLLNTDCTREDRGVLWPWNSAVLCVFNIPMHSGLWYVRGVRWKRWHPWCAGFDLVPTAFWAWSLTSATVREVVKISNGVLFGPLCCLRTKISMCNWY